MYYKYVKILDSDDVSNSAQLSVFIDELGIVEKHLQFENIAIKNIMETESLHNAKILMSHNRTCEQNIISDENLIYDNINGTVYWCICKGTC